MRAQALKICAGDKVVVVVSPVLDEEWDAASRAGDSRGLLAAL